MSDTPDDAIDAYGPEFIAAYTKATGAFRDAIIEFERATGRVVDSIGLTNIDVTSFADHVPRTIRTTELRFLPKPGEVSW